MMRFLFNPNDWLARNERLCLILIAILILIGGSL